MNPIEQIVQSLERRIHQHSNAAQRVIDKNKVLQGYREEIFL